MKNKENREQAVPFDGTLPEGSPIPEQPKKKNKKRTKIAILSVFLAMCLLGGAGWFLLYGDPGVLDRAFGNIRNHVVGMYGSEGSHLFEPIDYDLDVTTVREYMDLDRELHYKDGGETVMVTDANLEFYGKDVQFFKRYFALVIAGDYDAYNAQFTDHYYETNEPYYSFTQQMVYDILIEKLSVKEEAGRTVYAYNVSYKIFRNNGTFRNDIDSDASRVLYFELVESGGTVKIDRITYYK